MFRLRASDADRELAVEILCAAAGDGRLSAAELDERLEVALTARTIGELAELTADLPGGSALRRVAGLAWCSAAPNDRGGGSRWAYLQSLVNGSTG